MKKIKIRIADHEKILLIDLENLLYCKADEGYSILFLKCGARLINCKSLTKFYDELKSIQEFNFIKIGQSYMVNSNFISCIYKKKKIILLENGEELQFTINVKDLSKLLGYEDEDLKEPEAAMVQDIQ